METKPWRWQRAHTLMAISLLFGWAGIDRFYERQVGWGIIKMATCGGAFIWYLVDAARYTYLAAKAEQGPPG